MDSTQLLYFGTYISPPVLSLLNARGEFSFNRAAPAKEVCCHGLRGVPPPDQGGRRGEEEVAAPQARLQEEVLPEEGAAAVGECGRGGEGRRAEGAAAAVEAVAEARALKGERKCISWTCIGV